MRLPKKRRKLLRLDWSKGCGSRFGRCLHESSSPSCRRHRPEQACSRLAERIHLYFDILIGRWLWMDAEWGQDQGLLQWAPDSIDHTDGKIGRSAYSLLPSTRLQMEASSHNSASCLLFSQSPPIQPVHYTDGYGKGPLTAGRRRSRGRRASRRCRSGRAAAGTTTRARSGRGGCRPVVGWRAMCVGEWGGVCEGGGGRCGQFVVIERIEMRGPGSVGH